jgi:ribA/ribD-fused uncharacterized protein
MFLTVPRSVLDKMPTRSAMFCKDAKLPDKIKFIQGMNGRSVYNDGRTVIIVTKRTLQSGNTQYKVDFLFYEHGLSMFARSEDLRIILGDTVLHLPCGEALFHMIKAALFNDWEAFVAVYTAKDPKTCKKAGRSVKGFKDEEWAKVSMDVMKEIARLKMACPDVFGCFHELAFALKDLTDDCADFRFTECNPNDNIYGIGISILEAADMLQTADVDAVFKDDFLLGKGKNHLGKAYDSAFYTFLSCGGHECGSVGDLASHFEEDKDMNFFITVLAAEEEGIKRIKTTGDADMGDQQVEVVGRSLSAAVVDGSSDEPIGRSLSVARTASE